MSKACLNKKYAKIWIYSAIQFVCAWRKKDIHLLPLPDITISQEEVLIEMNRDPSLSYFNKFTLELLDRLKFDPRKPSKTEYSSGVTRLELYIPPSLTGPIGLFIAIYLSHRMPGEVMEHLGETNGTPLDYRTYFGDEFMEAADQKCISNRRMNKSYLQVVEMLGNNNPVLGNPGGYLLAALCRNHSWKKVDKLTRTTGIYLDGEERMLYSKDFILLELFERGTCSFLVRFLIMALIDENFSEVSFEDETQIINEMGLSLRQTENFSKMFIKSSHEAQEAVKALISTREVDDIEQFILMVLHNISCGAAPDKGEHGMCLMAAANKECRYPHRENCWGCENSIVTTPMLIELASAYKATLACKKTAISDIDKYRYEQICNNLKEIIVGVFAYFEGNCNEIQKSLLLHLTNDYKEKND